MKALSSISVNSPKPVNTHTEEIRCSLPVSTESGQQKLEPYPGSEMGLALRKCFHVYSKNCEAISTVVMQKATKREVDTMECIFSQAEIRFTCTNQCLFYAQNFLDKKNALPLGE